MDELIAEINALGYGVSMRQVISQRYTIMTGAGRFPLIEDERYSDKIITMRGKQYVFRTHKKQHPLHGKWFIQLDTGASNITAWSKRHDIVCDSIVEGLRLALEKAKESAAHFLQYVEDKDQKQEQ